MNSGTNYFQHGEIDAGRFLEKKYLFLYLLLFPFSFKKYFMVFFYT
jgi:hypothetical protein